MQWTPAELAYLHDWNVILAPDGFDWQQITMAQRLALEPIMVNPPQSFIAPSKAGSTASRVAPRRGRPCALFQRIFRGGRAAVA